MIINIKPKAERDIFRQVCINSVYDMLQTHNLKEMFFFHPKIEALVFSNKGNVKNILTNKSLKVFPNSNGYLMVNVNYFDGTRRCVMIHRMVMESVLGYVCNEEYYEVNHIDGDKTNNNIENLEWVTRQENLQHARDNRLFYKNALSGEKSPVCKLNDKAVSEIREFRKLGFQIKEIAEAYSVNSATITSVIKDKKRGLNANNV